MDAAALTELRREMGKPLFQLVHKHGNLRRQGFWHARGILGPKRLLHAAHAQQERHLRHDPQIMHGCIWGREEKGALVENVPVAPYQAVSVVEH